MPDSSHHRDLVLGALAGHAALATRAAARALYDAGGRDVLPAAAQVGLQSVLTRAAAGTVAAAAPSLLTATVVPVPVGASVAIGVTAVTTARAAGAQLVRTAARAGLVGLALDAAFGAAEGITGYRRGTMSGKQACLHVGLEAGTGATSTTVGVLLAAGAVALTGLAGPSVMVIGTGAALATKLGLRRLLTRSRPAPPLPLDA